MSDIELLTRDQVTKQLQVSYKTLQRWEKKKWIEVVKLPGRVIRYKASTIKSLIDQLTHQAK